jgi:hypothetical protein
MTNSNLFLLKRPVDLSLLTDGFHIPTEFQPLVYGLMGREMTHGENREVKIIIGGDTFYVKLYNINFNQTRYPGHPDLLQIRYTANSPIAKRLQAIYAKEYNYLIEQRKVVGPRKQIHLPENNDAEIVFYGTMVSDVFVMECKLSGESIGLKEELKRLSEEEFESFVPRYDEGAGIREISRIQRIRQLDRSIGDSLKRLYGYRCQMTGEYIGQEQGVFVVEAHHIDPFTKSMNNDTSNILILSPNYHRIVHKANPEFRRSDLSFVFPNGLTEKVKLNLHL